MLTIIALVISYLLGSISCALIISRALGLGDPRQSGSGNAGATNVLRLSGKKVAACVLIGDFAKGLAAVLIAQHIFSVQGAMLGYCGLAAILGHIFPVFFGFKGGKGVATAAAVIFALNLWLGIAVVGIWLLVVIVTRYSSLAAIIACAMSPGYVWLFNLKSYFIPLAIMAVIIIIKHGSNIKRLLNGEEKKVSFKSKSKA